MSPSSGNVGGVSGFFRAHIYKAIIFLLSSLVVFEFSAMVFSQEKQLWIPSYLTSFRQLAAGGLHEQAQVVACNATGCWDQFGNMITDQSDLFFAANATNNSSSSWLESLLGLEMCPVMPPRLVGAVKVLTEKLTEESIQSANPALEPGGRFRPKECLARHKVAIILPFRDRSDHLRIFLNNIHPILQRQQLDYGIFIVEQTGSGRFNRGTLMNVGYVEAKRSYEYDCFIFHDVDLLPENDRNLYSCPSQPRHMSVAIDKFKYNLPYNTILGGVSAFTDAQFAQINGFPNIYWGWGGEDDDLSLRVRSNKMNISRYPAELARYKMIKHGSDPSNPANPIRFDLLRVAAKRFLTDGLSNLKYQLVDSQLKPLYTWLLVDIGLGPS